MTGRHSRPAEGGPQRPPSASAFLAVMQCGYCAPGMVDSRHNHARGAQGGRRRLAARGGGATHGGEESAAPAASDTARPAVAVALKADAEGRTDRPPRVIATGRAAVAEAILEIAFREGVKVREDADLAEILAAVDIDSEIPTEALIAVAEILRYLYAGRGGPPGDADIGRPPPTDHAPGGGR